MTIRLRRTTQSLIAPLVVAATVLTACSGKSPALSAAHVSTTSATSGASTSTDAATDSATGSISLPSFSPAAPAEKLSDVSMRVVNLYAPKGASGPPTAGPAVDIYDVQLNGQSATPVATNVAYGSASPYFTGHEPTNAFGHPAIELYALPAGEDPKTKQADAKGIGGVLDDGSHAQVTFVLTADNSGLSLGGALGRLSFRDRVEKGDDGDGTKAPVAPAPASGQAQILVDTSAVIDDNLLLYALIGRSCAPPINGDPNAKGLPEIFNAAIAGINTPFAIFATTPGTHQVSVVDNQSGVQPTCAQLNAKPSSAKQGTTTVDVTAGQQVEVYVYGTSATDLHLALAPIRP
jgi:hypothetical protein